MRFMTVCPPLHKFAKKFYFALTLHRSQQKMRERERGGEGVGVFSISGNAAAVAAVAAVALFTQQESPLHGVKMAPKVSHF